MGVPLFLWLAHPASGSVLSGGSPKGEVDPFYYGKPGGSPSPPFPSLLSPTDPASWHPLVTAAIFLW